MSAEARSAVARAGNSAPSNAPPGFDREYLLGFLRRRRFSMKSVFRLQVEGLEHLQFDRPGLLVGNHNWGCWGITEVIGILYAWYLEQTPRAADGTPVPVPPLIGQGGPELQQIPGLKQLVQRAGIVVASLEGMRAPLKSGSWVLIQPGAVVDQGRPIWMRRRSRMQKISWLGPRRVLTDQLGYIAAATEGGYPIYPVAWSGTHELSPILFESTWLLRWTGLAWLRRAENLPSFPITLNHFINLGVFLLTPLATSPWGWLAFAFCNIYLDFFFCYPIFPFQHRIAIGKRIEVPDLSGQKLGARQRQEIYRQIHVAVRDQVDQMLVQLDTGRPWVALGEKVVALASRTRQLSQTAFTTLGLLIRGRRQKSGVPVD